MTLWLALDIGGTQTRAATIAETGVFVRREQAATPLELDTCLNMIWRLADDVLAGERPQAVGVSIGGPLDWRTGRVSPLHQPAWRDVPFREMVAERFGCPVYLDVDTNIAVAGEYLADPDRPQRLLYLTLSTGMGGGFLVGGRIYRGGDDAHPEIAHQAILFRCRYPERVVCECGGEGCLEALISGNGIRRVYGVPAERLDPDAWAEVAYNLGQGLRNLAAICAPDVIVLAGSVALGGGPQLLAGAMAVLHRNLRIVPIPRVRLSTLGQDSALVGAATVARYGYNPVP